MKFDWNQARAFLVTAEEGSLSAAARALGLTQPTLGRQVAALEEELGVALFERVGRGLTLTPSGTNLLEYVRRMGEAANQVMLSATGHTQRIEGSICIAASDVVAGFLLPPILSELRTLHPGIDVKLVASNAVSDLRKREADVAIRSGKPTDPSLVATRLRDTPAHLYATPEYLARLGNPATPEQLKHASFIGFKEGDYFLPGLNALGIPVTRGNFPLHTENHWVSWGLVKQGLGIGAIIEDVGDSEPMVTRALPTMAPIPVQMWLVAHREVRTSRRVRAVFELILRHLGPPKPEHRRGGASRRGGRQ